MSETVMRHRGGTRDENGQHSAESDTALLALEVAPGGGSRIVQQARDGETIAATVYFAPGIDVRDGDDLTVRSVRYRTIVNDWSTDGQGGLEVFCARGQG